jgi:opacity protein-like surface antigen
MINKAPVLLSQVINFKFIFLTLSAWTALSTPSLASEKEPISSRFIFAVGAGGFNADAGKSQTIPIFNPVEDEFFVYTPNRHTHVNGLFDLFIGKQWGLNPNWSLQLGLDYTILNGLDIDGSLVQGADFQSADTYIYRYQLKTQQLQVQSKFLYNYQSNLHPYALLGLGAAFNKANQFITNVPSFLTFTRIYQDNSNSSFTYTLGLGIDMDMSENIRLGIGYRFTDFGKIKLGAATIDNISVPGTLPQSNVHANLVLAQISFIK